MRLPSLVLIASLAAPLAAQMVQQGSATRSRSSHRASALAATRSSEAHTISLSSVGIAPRTLAAWKRTDARAGLSFLVLSFQRSATLQDGEGTVYEVTGQDYFSHGAFRFRMGYGPETLALMRASLQGKGPEKEPRVEWSTDNGATWTTAEKDGSVWKIAMDSAFITLSPLDEAFTPTVFKAQAFERGAIVKTDTRGEINETKRAPYYQSAVIATAMGTNECEGILKYPGTSFVVPFKGIHYGDKWILRSLDRGLFESRVQNHITSPKMYIVGAASPAASYRNLLQFEMNDQHMLVGDGPEVLDYGQDGDPTDALNVAEDFETASGKDLPALAQAYKTNFTRAVWTKSDEPDSFSQEAEKAFVGAGCTAWYWMPMKNTVWPPDAENQKAPAAVSQMAQRIKALGGKVGLLDPDGKPIVHP